MSKSLGNVTSPPEIIEKHGRDEMRYYFSKNSKGEDFAFDEKEFKDIRNLFRVLVNVNNFVDKLERKKSALRIEDKWILSRFNSFLEDVQKSYEKFRFPEVTQKIEKFVIEDLSKKYIKLIRERENETSEILNKIRNDLLVVLSPFIPFVTEKIWQDLRKKGIVREESVHLCKFPNHDKKKIDRKLEEKFDILFSIIEKGLAERDKVRIGLKWPLAKATVVNDKRLDKDVLKLMESQLNVKKIEFKQGKELKVSLDTKQTPELEAEGYARELSRQVQDFRKKLGLQKKNLIELFIITDESFRAVLEPKKNFIKDRTNSKKIEIFIHGKVNTKERFKNKIEFRIKDKRGLMGIIVTKR